MSVSSLARHLYYAHLSQPPHERLIYRWIKRQHLTSLVEIGMGSAVRSARMVAVASQFGQNRSVLYTGVDLFEARNSSGAAGVTLKGAYRLLRPMGVRFRLVPGDALAALSRHANQLTGTDLLVISADQDPYSLSQAWVYVPRMLHPQSVVLLEQRTPRGMEFHRMSHGDVEAASSRALRRRKVAA